MVGQFSHTADLDDLARGRKDFGNQFFVDALNVIVVFEKVKQVRDGCLRLGVRFLGCWLGVPPFGSIDQMVCEDRQPASGPMSGCNLSWDPTVALGKPPFAAGIESFGEFKNLSFDLGSVRQLTHEDYLCKPGRPRTGRVR